MIESAAFKDFTLQQQCRFNRFSQSASPGWSVMFVLVFIFVPLLTNLSVRSSWLRALNEQSAVFLEQREEQRAAAVAPRLRSWHQSWAETQIHGESAAFPLGPNREHMSHTGFSHRLLDRTVRRTANLLSYFSMPGSVTHGNATLVKVYLQHRWAMLLWFCDLLRTCFIKGSLNRDQKSFCFFLHEGKPARWY